MALIAVATRKGGVGKTTIATNLAAAHAKHGHAVKLVDSDFDEYAFMWGTLRDEMGVKPEIKYSKMRGDIYAALKAEKETNSTVIVDVGGKHSPELVYAVGICDVLVLPVKAGQFDVWSLAAMAQMVRACQIDGIHFRVVPVMNDIAADERNVLNQGLENDLAKLADLFGKPCKIVHRNAFSLAAMEGKGVLEMARNRDTAKAQDEIAALYAEVFK